MYKMDNPKYTSFYLKIVFINFTKIKMSGIINIASLPPLKPAIEENLLLCLSKEVDAYSNTILGMKCHLCPFRTLSSKHFLRTHLKYHCEKNMYLADRRSPQRAVVRAYFDYLQSTSPIAPTKLV